MFNLIMAVLCTAIIFLSFSSYRVLKINTLHAVIINYWVCVITGGISLNKFGEMFQTFGNVPWLHWAIMMGILFISTFYLMAITTQTAGVSVATLATKMSLLIPVAFSILILKTQNKTFDILNYIGIVLSIVSIILASYKSKKGISTTNAKNKSLVIILAFTVFFLTGFIDTTLQYINYIFFKESDSSLFLMYTFLVPAIIGTAILSFQLITGHSKFEFKSVLGGLYLGIPNFFSIFFLFRALSDFNHDGAFLFPVLNILIIIVSSFLAVLLFKERLSKLNFFGIMMAVVALLLIAYQEIFFKA